MRVLLRLRVIGGVAAVALTAPSFAGFSQSYDYTASFDGQRTGGLSARATYTVDGTSLSILLENTSTGVPDGAQVSDSLLVSLAFSLGDVSIMSGNSAVIGEGSVGLGMWAALGPGDSVADEWLWTNDFGGDLLEAFSQVISTSMGQGGGLLTDFNGNPAEVNGPFGGIAAAPPLLEVPGKQRAVSNGIFFELTLSDTLSEAELEAIGMGAVVEFGSDYRYIGIPTPSGLAVLLTGAFAMRRRRRN